MAVALEISDAKRYGANGENVGRLLERLMNIDWYQNVGKNNSSIVEKTEKFMNTLGIETYQVEVIKKEEVTTMAPVLSLEESHLWQELKEIPEQIKQKIEESERNEILEDIVYNVPELVYHGAFKGAYDIFEKEKTVAFLVGYAMYVSVLACAWEIVSDLKGWEDNPFLYIVEILEDGHLPLGPQSNTFFIS
ncbi:hypothetical protein ACE1TI_01120 [Alteribacillus sp. JSM 102045]|uniref:hypothetical protein n=1 Tax=Alteribacillus sp. JSM 102045 TaxID=1562101 RepID=UPI0035C2574D